MRQAGSLGIGKSEAGANAPARARMDALGPEADLPLDPESDDLLRILCSSSDHLWARPHSGVHLAIPRKWHGVPYTHHGVYMGDGSVVDFNGEPGDMSKERVRRRCDLQTFLKGQPLSDLRECRPGKLRGRPLSCLTPAVIQLRAMTRAGRESDSAYNLIANNCEHFSTWAQLGCEISAQVRAADRLRKTIPVSPDVDEVRAWKAIDGALQELVLSITVKQSPFKGEILTQRQDDPLPIDIGRAFWARDIDSLIVHMPIWEALGEPVAGSDRPWALLPLTSSTVWHRDPPSEEIDPTWHASLIAFPNRESFWLLPDGDTRLLQVDLLNVVESKLERVTRVLSELIG